MDGVTKVFIIDDSVIARAMLAKQIKGETDIEIVGEAGTGQGGVIMLGEVSPDVVLLEAAVGGGMAPDDIITEISNITPDTKIIIIADYSNSEQIPEITRQGKYDFVQKPLSKNTLLRAIRNAARTGA